MESNGTCFVKTYPFFQKTNFFQLSLVIKNFSTQMYFEITNIAPRRLIMYKTDSFISADEITCGLFDGCWSFKGNKEVRCI